MGWMETCAVDERMRFVLAIERREESMGSACLRFGISRKTGYKWLGRYRETGFAGLLDQSRAPQRHPQAIGGRIAERCLEVRRGGPPRGPGEGGGPLGLRPPAPG